MPKTVSRQLAYEDPDQQTKFIGQHEIAGIPDPVVILGDPGLGKSVLTKALAEIPGMHRVPAGKFSRASNPSSLIPQGHRIVIDGLDEIASSVPGGGIHAVLSNLSAMGYPSFVLSCREVDWRGAADRVAIEDDYGAAPVLLHLQPFVHADAHEFLSYEFPNLDPDSLLDHLAMRGLEGMYENPLTLRLMGAVAQREGPLPETRAQLLDRASLVMLKEENPHHTVAPHAQRTPDQLLHSAGAMCATQLLCDLIGFYDGPYANKPEGYAHVSDLSSLPFGDAARDALKTRLFEAEGEHRFTYVHRVMAEFLGARWLAACFDRGFSRKRIFALLRHGQGVPTSLRGLHAWIAHFSPSLASQCIAADPYAVLRYGDAEKLALPQARDLLTALKDLSEQDPYFRSEDWTRHPASGLMRSQLSEEIRSIIATPGKHAQLSMLLIDATIDTPLAEQLSPTLEQIFFDPDRAFAERSLAAEALSTTNTSVHKEQTILRLLGLADPDSARLAYNILTRLDARTLSIRACVDAFLAHLGLTDTIVSDDSRLIDPVSEKLFEDIGIPRLSELLDELVASAKPFLKDGDHWSQSALSDLVRRRTLQVLGASRSWDPQRVWTWISPFDRYHGRGKESRLRLTEFLERDRASRAKLQEYVLLTPCASNTWMAGQALGDADLGLYPTPTDLASVLKSLSDRATNIPIESETWRHLLRLVRSADGLPDVVRTTAAEVANGNSKLQSILDEMSTVTIPEWQIRQQQQDAADHEQRAAYFQARRDLHSKYANEVAAGDSELLVETAAVYLDRHLRSLTSTQPHERVREFLGDDLGDNALDGLIAVLERTDLHSPREIAEVHSQQKRFKVEPLLISGIAEAVRRGQSLDPLGRPALAAAYMAWQRSAESNTVNDFDVGSAIETVLFTTEEGIEAHFRASIEPQLANQTPHVQELYRFTRENRWRAVASRLGIEWLDTYPEMPADARTQLTMCALATPRQPAGQSVLLRKPPSTGSDEERRLLWLLALFVLDFDNSRATLEQAVATTPQLLWLTRDLVKWPGAEPFARLSIPQHAFIVQAFNAHWPNTQRPTGVTRGDVNKWDASDYVRNTIFFIASRPAPEATDALQALTLGPAATYEATARRALAEQRQLRRDFEYKPPTVAHLQSVMTQGLPQSIDDMRAYFLDRLDTLQERMRGSNTDTWKTYWSNSEPHKENDCRNRLIDHISGNLPDSIQFVPEMHSPGQTRADIAAIRNSIGLPVEIKCQWHKDVWDAATEQLEAKYARDWHAKGRGVYIVIWFGRATGKRLRTHPDGLDRPDTPKSLSRMLQDRIPTAKRSLMDVFVLDVTNPQQRG